MKQKLGSKKHRLCEAKAGKKYIICLTRGGWKHFVAECWFTVRDADLVNWKTGEVEPDVRDGKVVEVEEDTIVHDVDRAGNYITYTIPKPVGANG